MLSGRLIPFGANLWTHVNCALWSDGCFDNADGMLFNFYFSFIEARFQKCAICNELGASVSCFLKNCGEESHTPRRTYHFHCALKAAASFNGAEYKICCAHCLPKFENMPAGFLPSELKTSRRVYIVSHQDRVAQALGSEETKINTWRPYYYDAFNRVGNLTVLSLNEQVDALIKAIASKKTNI